MAVENSKRLDATDKEHIRRIKSTYTMKYTAMAVINAKLGCGMKEAYRLYDECNENPNNNKKMNINEFIFSRTQPPKKIDTINALTESELLSIREETVKRIVKDAGRRIWKTRDKRLRISQERRAGNAWNSSIDEVQLIKGKLHLEVYLQYENTDTSTSEEYDVFFRNGNYRGEIRRLDRHGNGRTYYFLYNPSDKASVMKSILLEYVFTKYAAKLTQQEA